MSSQRVEQFVFLLQEAALEGLLSSLDGATIAGKFQSWHELHHHSVLRLPEVTRCVVAYGAGLVGLGLAGFGAAEGPR